jgi:hypothetical protein
MLGEGPEFIDLKQTTPLASRGWFSEKTLIFIKEKPVEAP